MVVWTVNTSGRSSNTDIDVFAVYCRSSSAYSRSTAESVDSMIIHDGSFLFVNFYS